jgi:hypothetical protein
MSKEEVDLLRKLGEAEAMSTPELVLPRPGQTVRRRTTEITMSEAEVELLRKLGEPTPEPPAGVSSETSPDETADIVLNRSELDFLISLNEDELPSGGPDLVKRSLVQSRLRALVAASSGSAGDLLATPVTRPEAEWLDWVTRVRYSYVTQQERRARLVLREKIHTALKSLRAGPGPTPDTD